MPLSQVLDRFSGRGRVSPTVPPGRNSYHPGATVMDPSLASVRRFATRCISSLIACWLLGACFLIVCSRQGRSFSPFGGGDPRDALDTLSDDQLSAYLRGREVSHWDCGFGLRTTCASTAGHQVALAAARSGEHEFGEPIRPPGSRQLGDFLPGDFYHWPTLPGSPATVHNDDNSWRPAEERGSVNIDPVYGLSGPSAGRDATPNVRASRVATNRSGTADGEVDDSPPPPGLQRPVVLYLYRNPVSCAGRMPEM